MKTSRTPRSIFNRLSKDPCIPVARISPIRLSESNQIAADDMAEGHEQNRRVDVTLFYERQDGGRRKEGYPLV